MKHWIQKGVSLLVVVTVLLGQTVMISAATNTVQEENLKIAVLSDTHYLSPTMIKDTEDFTTDLNSDRKMFVESDALLTGLLEAIKVDQPDVLLISGDLTKDGEKEGHQEFAAKLEAFRDENLPDLKIYVTPGNHDVNNSNGKNFNTSDGIAVLAGRTSQEDFRSIYGELTYNDESIIATFTPAEGKQGGGLSYVARPKDGFTIISIDTARYSADNTDSGMEEHETSGIIGAELEQWVVEQITAAKERGDTVIGLQHHGMIPHFSQEPTLLADYLIRDYGRISTTFADAGMGYIFTGHMHANDIASMTTAAGNTLYDIETGSVVTYPSPARFVTINRTITNGEVTEDMNVKTHLNVGPVTFENPMTQEQQTIADITAYGQEHGFTDPMLSTTLNGFLDGFLADVYETGSKEFLMGLVNDLLGDSLPGGGSLTLEKLVDVGLPLLLPDATSGETVYYDSSKGGIVVSIPVLGTSKANILISNQGLKDTLNTLFTKIDNEVLSDPTIINQIVNDLVPKLTAIPLTADGHTLLDYANYIYQSHLGGEEAVPMPAWVEEATTSVENGEALSKILDVAVVEITGLLDTVLSNITFEEFFGTTGYEAASYTFVPSEEGRTPLLQPADSGSGSLLGLALGMFAKWKSPAGIFEPTPDLAVANPELGYTVKDFANALTVLGLDINQMLIELVLGTPEIPADEVAGTPAVPAEEGLLTSDLKNQANDMILGIVTSMGTDENYQADNNTDITRVWKLVTDRTALDEAIAQATAIDGSKYTSESVQALLEALEAANTLPLTATQEEMDQATKAVMDAISALKVKIADSTNPADSGNSDATNSNNNPETGDTNHGSEILLTMFMLAGAGIVTAVYRKRKITN